MNITDKRIKGDFVDFKDVECGLSFECGQNNFYMKVNDTDHVSTNTAINLKNGILCIFGDKEKVRLVDASIIIN